MQYHIQTAPIWDAYKKDGCPICKLREAKEATLVKQYLSDNVMDPDFRIASNSAGFCADHIRALYDGQNKLGLALQLETRAAFLNKLISKAPADKKSAKKTADCIQKHVGCVICSTLDEIMPRYYMTVAQMFNVESEFPALFSDARHCLKHAECLYRSAEYAGKSTAEYLRVLTAALKRELKATETALRAFADCFDFKNAGARPDTQALPSAIRLLITDKITR